MMCLDKDEIMEVIVQEIKDLTDALTPEGREMVGEIEPDRIWNAALDDESHENLLDTFVPCPIHPDKYIQRKFIPTERKFN